MNLKGAAIILGFAATLAARADSFSTSAISTSGDFAFGAIATYWDPHVNQVTPTMNISLNVPDQAATLTVVSQGTALGDWWFVGESYLTFAGSVYWNGTPDPNAKVRVTSTIKDTDNNLQYQMVSTLDSTGSHWDSGLVLSQATKHVQWSDKIELVSGSTGTLAQWVSTNHTMNMSQVVPEPASLASLALVAGLYLRRKLKP